MTESIDTVKQLVEYIVRKKTSGFLDPTQFNLVINSASLSEFMDYIGNEHTYQPGQPIPPRAFELTQNIIEKLKVFKESDYPLIIDAAGQVPFPTDHVFTLGIGYITGSGSPIVPRYVPIEIVDEQKKWYRLSSKIVAPDKKFPICVIQNTYFQFFPVNLQSASLSYIRYPRKAIWNYTLTNNRPVFNPVGSVDLEWEKIKINDIVIRACSLLGISIKDAEIVQYIQQKINEGL